MHARDALTGPGHIAGRIRAAATRHACEARARRIPERVVVEAAVALEIATRRLRSPKGGGNQAALGRQSSGNQAALMRQSSAGIQCGDPAAVQLGASHGGASHSTARNTRGWKGIEGRTHLLERSGRIAVGMHGNAAEHYLRSAEMGERFDGDEGRSVRSVCHRALPAGKSLSWNVRRGRHPRSPSRMALSRRRALESRSASRTPTCRNQKQSEAISMQSAGSGKSVASQTPSCHQV